MKQYLSEILYLLGSDRSKVSGMVLLFLVSSTFDLVSLGLVAPYVSLVLNPQALDGALRQVVEAAGLPTGQEALLMIIGGALVGVFLLKTITTIWTNSKIIHFSQNQQVRLCSLLMQAYQNMPYTDYLRRNSSEYIHSTHQLTYQYSNGVILPMMQMLSGGIVTIVIIGFLAWTNTLAVVLMLGLLGSMLLVYDRLFRRKLGLYGKKFREADLKIVKGVQEGIEGLKEIRILGKQRYFHSMVRTGAEGYALYNSRSKVITAMPRYLLELVLISFIVLLVIMTLQLGGNLQTLAPMLAMFSIAALRLIPMFTIFSVGVLQLRFNRHAVSQLYDDLKQVESNPLLIPMPSDNSACAPFRKLVLEGVHFHYPNSGRKALDGIDLEIQAGEAIGLIGTSGSGKTTLVDMMLGLLEPQQGQIHYNDTPLHDALGDWRSQVAYLPQQVFLIDDSLRCNVALGIDEDKIDNDRLYEALRQARLMDHVEQLPQGVNTLLGERGVRLSGGQRQRVAMARAFYHGRDVLIMDEATSALDNATEREIIDEIQRLKGTKTMIVIAHRLTTVQYCDRIYKLENGKIVSSGTPKEMLSPANYA